MALSSGTPTCLSADTIRKVLSNRPSFNQPFSPFIYLFSLPFNRSCVGSTALDKDNQDAFIVLPDFGSGSERQAFFGIFDGHGKDGHHCARFARDNVCGDWVIQ